LLGGKDRRGARKQAGFGFVAVAVVTTQGTLVFKAQGGNAPTLLTSTLSEGLPNCTGYTALKVA